MTDEQAKAELIALLKARTFKRGRFTLASGRESRIYFNMKATMMHPRGARLCAEGLLAKLNGLDADYVSGLEMGAVPLLGAIAAISDQQGSPVPATFVRKSAKDHGTRVLLEGLDEQGGESLASKRVVLIDDVATTGGAVLKAAEQISAAGGRVTDAIVIVDRQEGASEALRERGIALHALVTASDLGVTDEDRQPF